jgi:hypothetical protein
MPIKRCIKFAKDIEAPKVWLKSDNEGENFVAIKFRNQLFPCITIISITNMLSVRETAK